MAASLPVVPRRQPEAGRPMVDETHPALAALLAKES